MAEKLYHWIARRIETGNLNMTTIANQLGVSPEYISMIKSGRREPHLNKIPYLAELLELDPPGMTKRALYEYAPLAYATLFGREEPGEPKSQVATAHTGNLPLILEQLYSLAPPTRQAIEHLIQELTTAQSGRKGASSLDAPDSGQPENGLSNRRLQREIQHPKTRDT